MRRLEAQEVGEGEHRRAANRLRTEHKEVGSGSGAGSAEVGTSGGLASTGSGESLQVSCDWTVAFSCWSKGQFQQADMLRYHLSPLFRCAVAVTCEVRTHTAKLSDEVAID